MKLKMLSVTVFFILAGCQSNEQLVKIEQNINILDRKITDLENKITSTQRYIKNSNDELKSQNKQTNDIIDDIKKTLSSIRKKTDKFKVRKYNGTLLFEPVY